MTEVRTYERAMDTLEGIEAIAKAEQIRQGRYLFSDEIDEKLAREGAVCRGYKACLIGSAYLSYGVKTTREWNQVALPGVDEVDRPRYLRNRPGLKLAIRMLDETAEPLLPAKSRNSDERMFASPAEEYFEVTLRNKSQREIRAEILKLVRKAKRSLVKLAEEDGVEFI